VRLVGGYETMVGTEFRGQAAASRLMRDIVDTTDLRMKSRRSARSATRCWRLARHEHRVPRAWLRQRTGMLRSTRFETRGSACTSCIAGGGRPQSGGAGGVSDLPHHGEARDLSGHHSNPPAPLKALLSGRSNDDDVRREHTRTCATRAPRIHGKVGLSTPSRTC
jgi:hypothetical protein